MTHDFLKILLGLLIFNCIVLNARNFSGQGYLQPMGTSPDGMPKGFKPPLTDVSFIKNKYLNLIKHRHN